MVLPTEEELKSKQMDKTKRLEHRKDKQQTNKQTENGTNKPSESSSKSKDSVKYHQKKELRKKDDRNKVLSKQLNNKNVHFESGHMNGNSTTNGKNISIISDMDQADPNGSVTNGDDLNEDTEGCDSDNEVSFPKRSFDLKLPSSLKYSLIFDHDMIMYRKCFATLPALKTVKQITDHYLGMAKKSKRGRKSIYLDYIFKYLIDSFEALLGNMLLYSKEKAQVIFFCGLGTKGLANG